MFKFDPIRSDFSEDTFAKTILGLLQPKFEPQGRGYYKHPNLGTEGMSSFPDLTFVTQTHAPLIVSICKSDAQDLPEQAIEDQIDQLKDMREALQSKFQADRQLRNKVIAKYALALPLVSKFAQIADTARRFLDEHGILITKNDTQEIDNIVVPMEDHEYRLVLSIVQTASVMKQRRNERRALNPSNSTAKTDNVKTAIEKLDSEILLLDQDQEQFALNFPPGPQCIRGLAGTGKTILLAMKAASIHSHHPEKKLLFTFNTQSLYNQAKSLITRFYRTFHYEDPDWDQIHIRHAWGGKHRAGVYSDFCRRMDTSPLTLDDARARDSRDPFRACCKHALSLGAQPYYDYVLVDEGQDFGPEFFQLLWAITSAPHCIYYAYDDMQSLVALEMPQPEELFGTDEFGNPRFTLDGEYPGPIEKVLPLRKSYRCPLDVLMLAHGLGLGIHGPRGPVQMLSTVSSWQAVGYSPRQSALEPNTDVEIERPLENSPNVIDKVYNGTLERINLCAYDNREAELRETADLIINLVRMEDIDPEDIIVISLDNVNVRRQMTTIQRRLDESEIESTIPGLVDDTAEFAERGRVTLSTIFRAKGNEAPFVFIIACEQIADYVQEISSRNRAFTSISRSKGWLWLSGIGSKMIAVSNEIRKIRADIPSFKFTYPDPTTIARLIDPAETTKRRKSLREAEKAAATLTDASADVINELPEDVLNHLLEMLAKTRRTTDGTAD